VSSVWRDLILALAIAAAVLSSLIAALHAILYKRDVRASIGWAGFILVAPYIGPLFYLFFGVNRIRRRAARRRSDVRENRAAQAPPPSELSAISEPLVAQALLGDRVCGNTLLRGNRVEILDGGERAFSAILTALAAARRSISLSTYIFEYDRLGTRVVDELAAAMKRGVEVRVLLDAVGSRSRRRNAAAELTARGIRVAIFLPYRVPGDILSINLRNHRKLIVVDDQIAFAGGMNISDDYEASPDARRPLRDVHFAVTGPIVAELKQTFAADWRFAAGERLRAEGAPPPIPSGALARVVADGPDEDFERTRWLIFGAIAMARRSIRIVTPYFLPDTSLINALSIAALRGVCVEILIPERLDHRVVKWASNALLWQVLEKGCRVWFTPPPFDHSKLFTVDGVWALFGSTNWDARSLRLNFELNVEVVDPEITSALDGLIDDRRRFAREITLQEIDSRTLLVRIRDGLARLLVPYL
jgi:cardiolipin synthase